MLRNRRKGIPERKKKRARLVFEEKKKNKMQEKEKANKPRVFRLAPVPRCHSIKEANNRERRRLPITGSGKTEKSKEERAGMGEAIY